jgi:hypothetical protein
MVDIWRRITTRAFLSIPGRSILSEQFPIPLAALAPAASEWRMPETPSIFDSVFESANPDMQKRRADPTYYIFHREDSDEDRNPLSALTYFEARTCSNAGVFRSFSKVRQTHVAVNEHAMNAYDDFCRSVSQAWREYQAKLDRIPQPVRYVEDDEN